MAETLRQELHEIKGALAVAELRAQTCQRSADESAAQAADAEARLLQSKRNLASLLSELDKARAVYAADLAAIIRLGGATHVQKLAFDFGGPSPTLHQVQPPLGVDRYSMAYFAGPDYDTLVAPLDGAGVTDSEACAEIHAGRALAEFVAGFDEIEEAGS